MKKIFNVIYLKEWKPFRMDEEPDNDKNDKDM